MAVPKIRFPGFTEDWEQRKLGEISEKVTTKNQDMVVNEVFTNSAEYGIISQQDFFDKDIANSNKVDGYYLVEPDDFVYNPRISNSAPFGPIKRNKLGRSGAMSPLYYVFRSHDVDKSYLDWFFQTNRWHAFMRFHGNTGVRSDRFAITDKIFAEMTISIPQDIDEQKAIGTFFTALDDSITLHQRKLESMKLLKKSLLQKMFPKSGETVPEVRFPGFTDAWEQRKFAELANIRRGLTYKPNDVTDSGIRVLRSSNINEDSFIENDDDVFVKESAVNISSVKDGDILITSANGSNRLVGKHAIIFKAGQAVHGGFMLIASAYGNPYFLNASMSSSWYTNFVNMYVAGGNGAIGNLKKSDLENQVIRVPSEAEQLRIGQFFQSLDQTITLHQRKVEILHKLKKSLLRQMFV